MNVKKVLVIFKKSAYELYSEDYKDPSFLSQVQSGADIVQPSLLAHDDNRRTLDAVRAALDERGIASQWVYRARKRSTEGFDLVITVGGDGTLLDASHAVVNAPVLAVNSSPRFSVGHFCAASAETFAATLDRVIDDGLDVFPLGRLDVRVGERVLPYPALNEALFAHQIPAAMSRYVARLGDAQDEQKSSGMWVSTAAGSTAAIRSAGGEAMPLDSAEMQFLARELYHTDHGNHALARGKTNESLRLTSKMRLGAVYIDGHRLKYNVSFGETVTFAPHRSPLRLFWNPNRARARLQCLET